MDTNTDAVADAIAAVFRGDLVRCTRQQYPEVRTALQCQAGKWIDGGDGVRAGMALSEVRRLDALHRAKENTTGSDEVLP